MYHLTLLFVLNHGIIHVFIAYDLILGVYGIYIYIYIYVYICMYVYIKKLIFNYSKGRKRIIFDLFFILFCVKNYYLFIYIYIYISGEKYAIGQFLKILSGNKPWGVGKNDISKFHGFKIKPGNSHVSIITRFAYKSMNTSVGSGALCTSPNKIKILAK